MGTGQNFPTAGVILAGVTCFALLLLKVDPAIAIAVLLVWIGSLLVAAGSPPEPPKVKVKRKLTTESISQLIENSSTPVMVTDRNTIAIANRAARQMLGPHMVGQDARVAFRQPEAISLLAQERSGSAIVRGLVRRQDIWRINRQEIGDRRAVLELIN